MLIRLFYAFVSGCSSWAHPHSPTKVITFISPLLVSLFRRKIRTFLRWDFFFRGGGGGGLVSSKLSGKALRELVHVTVHCTIFELASSFFFIYFILR